MLRSELERKIQECQKMAHEFVEMERRKMEERMFQQQQEVEMLRQRLEDIESQLRLSSAGSASVDMEGGGFMKRLLEACSEDSDMVKSMDLDRSIDMETNVFRKAETSGTSAIPGFTYTNNFSEGICSFPNKAFLTTVYEEEECENEDEDKDNLFDKEVQKEVIEEKKMIVTPEVSSQSPELKRCRLSNENPEDAAFSRQLRIQNIFTLCGNYRELSQHNSTPMPAKTRLDNIDSITDLSTINSEDSAARMLNETSQLHKSVSKDNIKIDQNLREHEFGKLRDSSEIAKTMKENHNPIDESSDDIEVYVKWEASKEIPGKFITALKVLKDSTLADLRKLIEIHLGSDQQAFTFLVLGDPSGAPVPKEKESKTQTSRLPICNNQLRGRLACLRPVKAIQRPNHQPFSPLENKLPTTPNSNFTKKGVECFSPEIPPHLSSTPYITVRRY
ncbi:UNVERIFIED_CONTAM: Kinesin-like protein KIN-10A [Sesamum radiatum]|uniref:Kinesin-like protein KIN-10A n=1 Tax=Sesamum radiatum TaxID=300843 RepID=A0AAW2QGS1_SESRA